MGNNLQAQEQKSSKTTGWFVGVNPFSPSIELETKHSESYTNFTRTTETISGDIETRREVTVDSNITSTSAADLRVEYEINIRSIVVALNTEEIPATLQNKLDTVAAAKDLCLRDVREHASYTLAINFFHIVRDNKDANGNELYCNLPSDATALAEIASSLKLWEIPKASIIYRILLLVV